jgi:hypothetical protein
MNPVKAVVASVATIALTFSLQPHPRPFWESNIVFASEAKAREIIRPQS